MNKTIPAGEVWAGVPVRFICKVTDLVNKRRNSINKLIYEVDWIGEAEKKEINYPIYKKQMLEEVKTHFKVLK